MFDKFEKFVTSLGDWNHAFLAVFFVPAAAGVLAALDVYFGAAFTISLAYYFREVTASGKYNPNDWGKHDRKQQVYLTMVSVVIATIMSVTL